MTDILDVDALERAAAGPMADRPPHGHDVSRSDAPIFTMASFAVAGPARLTDSYPGRFRWSEREQCVDVVGEVHALAGP
jgi:hypothetical protein